MASYTAVFITDDFVKTRKLIYSRYLHDENPPLERGVI